MKLTYSALILCVSTAAQADNQKYCTHSSLFLKKACQRLHQIWNDGKPELYITGYAWHNRYTYTQEKIQGYNERAWGGGVGKGFYDEDGDWHGLYAMAFLDSHQNVEPAAGYAFLKIAQLSENIKAGLGYSVLVTVRPDLFHGIPFPGAAPWASIIYKQLSFSASYVPGSKGAGNVLFIFGKWTLE